jgi:hypothetical protein
MIRVWPGSAQRQMGLLSHAEIGALMGRALRHVPARPRGARRRSDRAGQRRKGDGSLHATAAHGWCHRAECGHDHPLAPELAGRAKGQHQIGGNVLGVGLDESNFRLEKEPHQYAAQLFADLREGLEQALPKGVRLSEEQRQLVSRLMRQQLSGDLSETQALWRLDYGSQPPPIQQFLEDDGERANWS